MLPAACPLWPATNLGPTAPQSHDYHSNDSGPKGHCRDTRARLLVWDDEQGRHLLAPSSRIRSVEL